ECRWRGARLAGCFYSPYAERSRLPGAISPPPLGTTTACWLPLVDSKTMQNVISIVLGGGRGTRLYPLTKYRSKPAVPLAGKYRLIDIPLSNCINSGFNKMYVLTQFLSVSLHRHIRQTYRFDHFNGRLRE